MRFMSLFRPAVSEDQVRMPSPADHEAMAKLIDDETKRGILVSTGGLLPSSQGARVRRSGSDLIVTDGPFAEAKEVIFGFAVVTVKTKEEAIEAAKRFLRVAGEGVTEVRPFYGSGFSAPSDALLFMLVWRPSKSEQEMKAPTEEEMTAMNALIERETRAGILVATGGLLPTALGARVRSSRGDISVTDGPFAEAKELIAGFGMFEVSSKEEAVASAKRFLGIVGDGECEVRPMFGPAGEGCAKTN